MKSFKRIILLLSCYWVFSGTIYWEPNNTVRGTVTMPSQSKKLLGRNLSYSSSGKGTVSEVNVELKILSHPDNNAFAILYPLSFDPVLKPTSNAVVTQKAQTFIPHVTAVTVGSTVYILNDDNEYHNVFSRTPKASFNIGRRPPGHLYPQKIKIVGLIKLFCDIHEHMQAFVLSLDTPYFVRIDQKGKYQIDHLPDGEYRVEIFHPKASANAIQIELKEGNEVIVNFDLSEK